MVHITNLSKLSLLICIAFVVFSDHAALAAKKVKRYDAVVYSNTNHRYKGSLSAVSETGLTIDYMGQPKFINADSISSIKIKRMGVLRKYALTGAVTGLAVGVPVYADGSRSGTLSSLAIPVVFIGTTLSGALLGSLFNAVIAVKRFNDVSSGENYNRIRPELMPYSESRHVGSPQ